MGVGFAIASKLFAVAGVEPKSIEEADGTDRLSGAEGLSPIVLELR
jgi:hypothetical protein